MKTKIIYLYGIFNILFLIFYSLLFVYFKKIYVMPGYPETMIMSWRGLFLPEIEIPLHHGGFLLGTLSVLYFTKKLLIKCKNIQFGTLLYTLLSSVLAFFVLFIYINLAKNSSNLLLSITIIFLYSIIMYILFLKFKLVIHKYYSKILTFLLILYSLCAFVFTSLYWYVVLSFRYPYQKIFTYFTQEVSPYPLPITQIQYIASFLIVIGVLYFSFKRPRINYQIISIKNSIPLLPLIAIIAVLLFIQIPDIPFFETDSYKSLLAPVNDMLGGKVLLKSINIQYGFSLFYFLFSIFSFIELNRFHFFIVQYCIHILAYTMLFVIFLKITRMKVLSIFGLLFLLIYQHFGEWINPLYMGQSGYLRFGTWIPFAFYLIAKHENNLSQKFSMIIEFLLLGLFGFWSSDQGTYFIFAYTIYNVVEYAKNSSISIFIVSSIKIIIKIFIQLFIWVFLYSLITFIQSHTWPKWSDFIEYSLLFSSGFSMLAIKRLDMHLLYTPIYIVAVNWSIYHFFWSSPAHKRAMNLSIIAFIIAIGLAQLTYYLGRSTYGTSAVVIAPLFLLLALFISVIINNFKNINFNQISNSKKIALISTIVIFASIVSFFTTLHIANTFVHIMRHRFDISYFDAQSESSQQSIAYINSILKNKVRKERKIAILSKHDTDILLYTKSTNIIPSNNFEIIGSTKQLYKILEDILLFKPPELYIDADLRPEIFSILMPEIRKYYYKDTSIGIVDIWKANTIN